MADARDFLPEAGPPSAGKSLGRVMNDLDQALQTVEPRPAVYVVVSADENYWYKGACRDLVRRLKDHRAGRVAHTKNRRPLGLAYFEYGQSYEAALKREKFLKSGVGRHWLHDRLQARVAEWQTQGT